VKAPLSWINEFLDRPLSAKEAADRLTLLGIEVEKIEETPVAFQGVVVGKVRAAAQHPNADRLRVATVFDGTQEHQVVCGAPNCRAGITVAFAPIGASLKDREGKVFKIKKGKLRDVESFGMICSEEELGLPQAAPGTIMELPEEYAAGTDFSSYYADPVLDISLTPNLGHCLSMLGIARELAASLSSAAKRPAVVFRELASVKNTVDVSVEDLVETPRYCCRTILGITVGPSPDWLAAKLQKCGLRSINNVVDAANFVMMELGQPLHVFDKDAIAGGKIVVSAKTPYKSLITLDSKEREIPPNTILVCDAEKPLAIAGIMGGLSSSATEKTKNIVIEAAVFSPSFIRKSSRLLDLKTDSSSRFDRGIDPAQVPFALDRAAALIQQVAGGEVASGRIDIKKEEFRPKTIACRLKRVNEMLGTELSLNEAVSFLSRLEMRCHVQNGDVLHVEVPTYRNDISVEIDLVEEIARIFGYNNLVRKSPRHISSPLTDAPIYTFEKQVRGLLLAEGLQECITCDLISPALAQMTLEKGLPEGSTISVLHPRSADQSVLRTSLLPGLLQVVKNNDSRQVEDFSAFEVGRIHFKEGSEFKEQTCAGIVLTGKNRPWHFDRKPEEADFFDLKGIVENLLEACGIEKVSFEPSHLHSLHPWRQAKVSIRGAAAGVVGEVHPGLLQELSLERRVYFAELNLHDLFPLRKGRRFSELAVFPGSERDWTVSLKESVPLSEVFQALQRLRPEFLESFRLLDLYQSEQIGKDRKNATFRMFYRDPKKTIDIETVERQHQKLTQAVAEKLKDSII